MRQWLINCRKDRQMTQANVAKLAGIAQPSYYAIEAGQTTPRPETAKRIGAALGIDWTRFYEEDGGDDIRGEAQGGSNDHAGKQD